MHGDKQEAIFVPSDTIGAMKEVAYLAWTLLSFQELTGSGMNRIDWKCGMNLATGRPYPLGLDSALRGCLFTFNL